MDDSQTVFQLVHVDYLKDFLFHPAVSLLPMRFNHALLSEHLDTFFHSKIEQQVATF